jgi:hypothetical protein
MPRCFLEIGNFLSYRYKLLLSIFTKIVYFIVRTFFKSFHSTAFLYTEDLQLLDTAYSPVSYFQKFANSAACKGLFVFWSTVLRLGESLPVHSWTPVEPRTETVTVVVHPFCSLLPHSFWLSSEKKKKQKKKLEVFFIFPLWLETQHFFFWGWGKTESILHVGHYVSHCTSPGW